MLFLFSFIHFSRICYEKTCQICNSYGLLSNSRPLGVSLTQSLVHYDTARHNADYFSHFNALILYSSLSNPVLRSSAPPTPAISQCSRVLSCHDENSLSPLCWLLPFSFRRNILNRNNSTYLRNCHYHRSTDPLCPIFTLGTIVKDSGCDFDALAYKVHLLVIIFSFHFIFKYLYMVAPQI